METLEKVERFVIKHRFYNEFMCFEGYFHPFSFDMIDELAMYNTIEKCNKCLKSESLKKILIENEEYPVSELIAYKLKITVEIDTIK